MGVYLGIYAPGFWLIYFQKNGVKGVFVNNGSFSSF